MSVVLVILIVLVILVAAAAAVTVVRMRASVHERIRELAGGLGYTSELAASLDPADVIDRTLDAVVALPGVDAALIVLGAELSSRKTYAAGLTSDEVELGLSDELSPGILKPVGEAGYLGVVMPMRI